jgi:glycosyltransferase involved in cell wall biosynthesis
MAPARNTHKPPAVSVIVPLYNKVKYISRALDSILCQTFEDFEVIIIDDGSTDNGPDIVGSYKDPRICIIRQPNAGPGPARNKGIRNSTAPLLSFLDADDEWLPDFLAEGVSILADNPDCAGVAFGYYMGSERAVTKLTAPEPDRAPGPRRLPPNASIGNTTSALAFIRTWASVFRREPIEQLGMFYSKARCTRGEDTYLWLQIVLNHTIYSDPRPMAWYHSEASDLYVGREGLPELSPIHTDPDDIRKNCQAQYRPLLERYLKYSAIQDARYYASHGDYARARTLVKMVRLRDYLDCGLLGLRLVLALTPVIELLRSSPRIWRFVYKVRDFLHRRHT